MEPKTPDTEQLDPLLVRKRLLRDDAHTRRKAQRDKDELSRVICKKFVALPEYASAHAILYYLDVRDEVQTTHILSAALRSTKRLVVPYCVDDRLELFNLKAMDELAIGSFSILEPKPELRGSAERRVGIGELDLIMVPGVAFDKTGARIGYGKGYYDKLLAGARPDAPLVALAFECQIVPEIPTDDHDVLMDKVLTEANTYVGKGRTG